MVWDCTHLNKIAIDCQPSVPLGNENPPQSAVQLF